MTTENDTQPDAPNKPGPKPRLVWIVTPEAGLHQVNASAVDGAISNDKGRRATERDLAIAGVIDAQED
ncbi:hypothetical protein [Brevundimonas sp.]|uniref:hypothetical protein n=1 Tax=Brevundimonas sp. TaxID=1871086 RepID=UPI00289F79F4|nr:hypothetical protein [Brevundimonas sp.]